MQDRQEFGGGTKMNWKAMRGNGFKVEKTHNSCLREEEKKGKKAGRPQPGRLVYYSEGLKQEKEGYR